MQRRIEGKQSKECIIGPKKRYIKYNPKQLTDAYMLTLFMDLAVIIAGY